MLQFVGTARNAPAPGTSQRVVSRLRRATWDVEEVAIAVRWGATSLAVVGAFGQHLPSVQRGLDHRVAGGIVLVAYALLRTLVPVRAHHRGLVATLATTGEAAMCIAVAAWSGGWASPYVLTVGGSLLLAGLLGGAIPALSTFAVVTAVTGAGLFSGADPSGYTTVLQRLPELGTMGIAGLYARRVFLAQAKHRGEIDRLRSAHEINDLLLELHARAAEQPAVLTLRATVATIVARLQDQLAPDSVVLLLLDPTAEEHEHSWHVAVTEGIELPAVLPDARLPGALLRARWLRSPLRCESLTHDGIDPEATSGLYAPLWARRTLVGLLAVERRRPPGFTGSDADVLEAVARHAGLAIDNTRWFNRLRSLGAEEERERIARELHDRVGQSLAAVALSADRMAVTMPVDVTARSELEDLAADIRAVTRELREELTDLRTGLNANADLVGLLRSFLDRVAVRSGLAVHFRDYGSRRLPEAVEQEVWRIAQEAVINAERHADASEITVAWGADGDDHLLLVADDGKGVHGAPLRRDAYGLMGMRERAAIIGATLLVKSAPGKGTAVRLRVRGSRQ